MLQSEKKKHKRNKNEYSAQMMKKVSLQEQKVQYHHFKVMASHLWKSPVTALLTKNEHFI